MGKYGGREKRKHFARTSEKGKGRPGAEGGGGGKRREGRGLPSVHPLLKKKFYNISRPDILRSSLRGSPAKRREFKRM